MRFRSGFTLIEILVVVSVSMIMVGIGLAQYSQFREEQGLLRAANKFATELREVQQRADVGKRETCKGIIGQQLSQYAVQRASEISAIIVESCINPIKNETLSTPIYLSDGITFATHSFSFIFPVLSQNTDVGINPKVILKSTTGRYCVEVTLNAGRDISILKLNSCP